MRKPILFFILFAIPLACSASTIKKADLAGSWYPDNPQALSIQIERYLKDANPPAIDGELIAIISPHAGIEYSGPVAAYGFKLAQGRSIDKVIIVGFSHKEDYDGIAVLNTDAVETPLGLLFTNNELIKKITAYDNKIFPASEPFNGENSLELILPFIQKSLGNPSVVLIAMGKQSKNYADLLSNALFEALRNEKNYLIIASTDMSHYLDYSEANRIDSQTAELIKDRDTNKLFNSCSGKNRLCGTAPVTAVMDAAEKLGANKAYILKLGNTGDVTKDFSRVVGYVSAALVKQTNTENDKMSGLLSQQQKTKLLEIARKTISDYVKGGKTPDIKETDPVLNENMGAFVTLHESGRLRGCIGNMVGTQPLYLTVRDMAIAACSEDPRFSPVSKEELKNIHIEISVLSPLKKINSADEIILGKHGVLVKQGFSSGVYLPQVATETGWTKEQFMNSLCGDKAGIEPDAWKKGTCEIYIFSAEVFKE